MMAVADSPEKKPAHYLFVLLHDFSMIAFASALEPLRLANRMSGKKLYQWSLASENGATAMCSNGTEVRVNMGLTDTNRETTILICGGINIKSTMTRPMIAWLRRESRKGMPIGGLCTATQLLAKAGLLEGKRATIHWENREAFQEEYPELMVSTAIFTIDGNRYSSAGGTSSADLMLKIIANDYGADLANAVADQMIYTTVRTDKDEQRLSVPTRIGVRHPKLATVIQVMEKNLEEPMSPSVLASDVGMSTRQLERLFRRYLNRSPKRYYMELRLQKARNLLLQTDMSVINVALACGFASPSHFSKCYRAHFATTPYRERGQQEVAHD